MDAEKIRGLIRQLPRQVTIQRSCRRCQSRSLPQNTV